ncbi:hypothetical protein Bca4012_001532 [Brassica carinata]|uniref:(rape) hypothetical protein n=1 Tax=Brassica napus TaxID=3708 RepID=A0A816I118_BRANA|nr:unnamed protein product [Brassica napus]
MASHLWHKRAFLPTASPTSTKPHCLPLRWPTEGLYPLVATPFRHHPSLYPLKLRLLHFLLASSPLFIVGLRPDQAIQTGGGGSPQPPWRDGEVVISLGGFAGVALRRCLRRSGQLLPPPSSLVSSCDRFGDLAPLFLKLQKEVGHCPLPLLDSQSKAWQLLEIAISGLDFTACDGRTRTCRPCFAYPSVEAPSRWFVVPRSVLRLRFSIDLSDFDAGSTALSCRLSFLDSLGLDSSKPIVSHCFVIKLMKFTYLTKKKKEDPTLLSCSNFKLIVGFFFRSGGLSITLYSLSSNGSL